MKEKLMLLLHTSGWNIFSYPVSQNVEQIADFLLKNGVIVPPCKVGDTVYIPWMYDGTKGIAFFEVTHIIIDRNKSYIKTNFTTDDEGFYELYNGGKFVFDEIGKTFFLTCEEAEQALKEGADNC